MVERFLKPVYRFVIPAGVAVAAGFMSQWEIDEKDEVILRPPPEIPIGLSLPVFDISINFIEHPEIDNLHPLETPRPSKKELVQTNQTEVQPTPQVVPEKTPVVLDSVLESYGSYGKPEISCIGWNNESIPTSLEIASINYSSEIQIAPKTPFDPKNPDEQTYMTPVEGIGTPTDEDKTHNTAYIFGHSSWNRERRDFANIEYLNFGDLIKVGDQNGNVACFRVVAFRIVNDNDDDSPRILRGPFSVPTVVMQTSRAQGYRYYLDSQNRGLLEEKVGENRPPDLGGYTALLVIAEQVSVGE